MIAALSAGIVDSPFPPVRVGILDGPGSLDGRFPARMPADETGRELPLPVVPLPMIPAAPVDLRLVDLPPLPAEEVDLADDDLLLPTLPSSLRLELRDCSDGRLLCLDSSDLRLLLLPPAAAVRRPPVALVAVAGRRGLVPCFFFFVVVAAAVPDLQAVLLGISSPSPTESSVSISSAKSTAGAFLLPALCCCCTDLAVADAVILVRAAVVCVPDVLVGDPAAIVPRLDVPLLVGPPVGDLPAPAVVLVVAVPGRRLLPGDLDRTGDLDLDRALALATAAPVRAVAALAGSGVVLRTGERDLALIASARALAALVIRTGERDLEERPLLLAVVLRAAAAEVVPPPSEAVTVATPAATADRVVVRRTGDRDRPRWVLLLALLMSALPPILVLVLVIFLPWSLSSSSLLDCTPFFFALLALAPTLLAGGRLGES